MDIELGILPALVIALTEAVKRVGLEGRFLPLASIVLGVGLNFAFKFVGVTPTELILSGVLAGLISSGLYDIGKRTLLNK